MRSDEDRPPNSRRSVCRTEGGASVAGTLLDPRAEAAGVRGPGAPAPRSVPPRRTEGVGDPPGTGRLASPRPLPQAQPCPRTRCAASAGSPQVSEGLGKARRVSLGPAASGPRWLLSGSLAALPPSQVRGARSGAPELQSPRGAGPSGLSEQFVKGRGGVPGGMGPTCPLSPQRQIGLCRSPALQAARRGGGRSADPPRAQGPSADAQLLLFQARPLLIWLQSNAANQPPVNLSSFPPRPWAPLSQGPRSGVPLLLQVLWLGHDLLVPPVFGLQEGCPALCRPSGLAFSCH